MCDCIKKVDGQLAEHNAVLNCTFSSHGPSRVVIETMKLKSGKKGKPPTLAATFCPFCGEKY